MVCLVYLIRDHKTRTGTVTYSNSAYHYVGNALNFKPRYCRSPMLLVGFRFDHFSFNTHLSFWKSLVYFFTSVLLSCLFPKKYCEQFCNIFKFEIVYCRVEGIYVAVIYVACCSCKNDIPFGVGVNFGRQEQIYLHTHLDHSKTWHNWHTIIITHPSNNYGKSYRPRV